jgi:metal-sulfur cluster biosynthetic enzyme
MSNATSSSKVSWDAENSHPDLIEPFRDAMRQIVDPEIGLNIIELGLVRNLVIHPDSAEVKMILTTPFCPYGPAMLEMTRKKAEEALALPVTIDLGMEMWDFSMMEEGARADWGMY